MPRLIWSWVVSGWLERVTSVQETGGEGQLVHRSVDHDAGTPAQWVGGKLHEE